jgi:hypothetical protein
MQDALKMKRFPHGEEFSIFEDENISTSTSITNLPNSQSLNI